MLVERAASELAYMLAAFRGDQDEGDQPAKVFRGRFLVFDEWDEFVFQLEVEVRHVTVHHSSDLEIRPLDQKRRVLRLACDPTAVEMRRFLEEEV